jgi:hypothetical protein
MVSPTYAQAFFGKYSTSSNCLVNPQITDRISGSSPTSRPLAAVSLKTAAGR